MGAKGHVQVIVPHLTESYSNQVSFVVSLSSVGLKSIEMILIQLLGFVYCLKITEI